MTVACGASIAILQPQPHLMHVRTRFPCLISSFCFCINFTDTTASLLQLSLKSPSFSRVFHWRTACAAVRNIDTSKDINEARRRSDVAGVCTHAQTAAQRRQSGGGSGASRTYDSHVDGDGDGDDEQREGRTRCNSSVCHDDIDSDSDGGKCSRYFPV